MRDGTFELLMCWRYHLLTDCLISLLIVNIASLINFEFGCSPNHFLLLHSYSCRNPSTEVLPLNLFTRVIVNRRVDWNRGKQFILLDVSCQAGSGAALLSADIAGL